MTQASPDDRSTPLPPLDRHFALLVVIATIVLLARGTLILRAHTEIMDGQFHLRSGNALLTGNPGGIIFTYNDAPLGQELMALPVVILGNTPDKPIDRRHWPADTPAPGDGAATDQQARVARTVRVQVLYGNRLSPDAIRMIVGLWKSLLFVPAIAVVFQWCRAIYGLRAGWFAAMLVLFDPTIAAHVPVLALDTLGVEGIVIACFCIWRYFESPTKTRLILAAAASAMAVLLKGTAVILPAVGLIFAAWYWVVIPWRRRAPYREWRAQLRPRFNAILAAAMIFLASIWILTGFDFSVPSKQFMLPAARAASISSTQLGQRFIESLDRRWPAGVYVGRFISSFFTSTGKYPAFLWDQTKLNGWWYYFPAVALYKIPIAFWVTIALAALSPIWIKSRGAEISLLIPLICWASLVMFGHIDVGYRHFLPAHVFLLMLSARCIADGARWRTLLAYTCLALGILQTWTQHPDYLSYLNIRPSNWYLHLTESNVDWGQAIKQTRDYLDRHPQLEKNHAIHFVPRWDRTATTIRYYLDDRVHLLDRGNAPPHSGIVIISPVWVTGVYDEGDNPYQFLRDHQPIDVIGHALLVYDLDSKEPPKK